jgi:glycosyltransferase involved in cell wall biosynthesis
VGQGMGVALTPFLDYSRTIGHEEVMIAGKTVSLCMVVYNSVELTKRAIESVKGIVDEIVLVDQGSTTANGKELEGMATVYHRTTNKGNADYDRMYCYALASKEFILAMDADETVPEETIQHLEKMMNRFEFDVAWFLFDNTVSFNDLKIPLSDILKDDPHPRFWRRLLNIQGKDISPIQWSAEAHTMPRILSDRQLFSQSKFNHHRSLEQIIRTHLHRWKGINQQAQQLEKGFVNAVLNKFPKDVIVKMNALFPELKTYLK